MKPKHVTGWAKTANTSLQTGDDCGPIIVLAAASLLNVFFTNLKLDHSNQSELFGKAVLSFEVLFDLGGPVEVVEVLGSQIYPVANSYLY